MRTINQSNSKSTDAFFYSNASSFTPAFLQNDTTTQWELNLTANVQGSQQHEEGLYTPIDRQYYSVMVQVYEPAVQQVFYSAVQQDYFGIEEEWIETIVPLENTAVASTRIGYINLTQSKLCGLPAFCSNQAYTLCRNVTLNQCEECSMTGAGIFAAVCAILGLLIVLGNGMVACVIIKNRLKDGFSMMKVSLAVADALTGFQLLVVALYNFHETIYNDIGYLDNRQLHLRGSPKAVAGGLFFLLTVTSSLYHLAFMSGQRFYAIKWPLKYRINNKTSVPAGLLAVWMLSILSASVPAWFPEHLSFTYQHLLFMFYISAQPSVVATNQSAVITLTTVFYVIPFVFMSILTIGTAILILLQRRSSVALSKMKGKNRKRSESSDKEVTVFVTVAMMQIGFALTIIPLIVVNSLYFGGSLDCSNVALPFTISFYFCIANSLINVLVYSIRDKRFRKNAVDLLCHCL